MLFTAIETVLSLAQDKKSSSPREFHPQALTEPDLNVSAHPALIVQSQGKHLSVSNGGSDMSRVLRFAPPSGLPFVDAPLAFCISSSPTIQSVGLNV